MWNTTFSIWHGPISCVTGKYSIQFIVTHGSYVQNNWPRDELFICCDVFQVLVLVLHIIILRYNRHHCTTLYYCKDPNKWIWMIFRQDVNLWLWHTHLIAKHHQHSSLEPQLILERWPPSTVLLICNTVGRLMQQPGGVRSRFIIPKGSKPRVCCHYSKSICGLPAELFMWDAYSGPDWSLR